MKTAVLDACILFKGGLTNFLLWQAQGKVFEPVWSPIIMQEWSGNLLAKMPTMTPENVAWRVRQMERAFPFASVEPDEYLDEALSLCATERERKDAHVVATAAASGATVIVTENDRDFPAAARDRWGVEVLSPRSFAHGLAGDGIEKFARAAEAHRSSMRNPPYEGQDYLHFLAVTVGLPEASATLRASQGRIVPR